MMAQPTMGSLCMSLIMASRCGIIWEVVGRLGLTLAQAMVLVLLALLGVQSLPLAGPGGMAHQWFLTMMLQLAAATVRFSLHMMNA